MENFSKKLTDYTKKLKHYYIKSRLPENEEQKLKDYVAAFIKNEAALTKLIEEEKTRRRNSPNDVDGQITNLKSQIKTLEDKIKNTPSSDTTNQQRYNREIE